MKLLLILLAAFLFISDGAAAYSRQKLWRDAKKHKPTMTMSETADMLCNVLVQASNLLLNEQSVDIDSIGQRLRNDCTRLPGEKHLVKQCEIAVDRHLPDILRHLQSGTKLDKICPLIKKGPTSKPKPKPKNLTSNATCVLCELLVKVADALATQNKSEQEILKALEKFCTILPNETRNECKLFVDQSAADIIALLVRQADPEKVCTLVKACSKSNSAASSIETMPTITPQCVLCEFIITYVEKTVGNNHSIAAVDDALGKVCNLLPTSFQPNCTHFVKLFGPAIALLIAKNESSAQVCTAIKVCNGTFLVAEPNVNVIEVEKPKANPVECAICQFVIGYVDKAIQNNQSQAAVDAALEKVCALLPHSMNATCVGFVEQYAPLILQYIIAHGTPDAVCQALKLCDNKTESAIPVVETPKANPVECAICQFVIGYVDKAIQNNKSQAAVDAALEKVCALLPHSFNATCVGFVETYAPVLLQYIIQHGTPDAVCQALKLCANKTESALPIVQTPKANPVECAICQFVIGYVDKAIQNNQSQAAVDAALEKVCALLPHSMNATCVGFVEQYAPLILQYIIAHGTPDAVCQALKLCDNKTETAIPVVEKPKANPVECAICQFVIGYVDKAIQNNKSQAAVDAALEKVCAILPHSMNATCVGFVEQYAPLILQYIIAHGTPDAVCQALKLCANKTDSAVSQETALPTITPQCVLCEFIITYVEKTVGNNHSIAAVDAALGKVCNLLPTSFQPNCTHFVKLFGPAIALLIAKNESSAQVCTAIKVCNGTFLVAEPNVNVIEVEQPKANPVECAICQFVIGYVDKAIQNNQSQAAVDAALEKVCALLPHSMNATCVGFVEQYAPLILQYIIAHGTPDAVCQALKLCDNKTKIIEPAMESMPMDSPQCTLCQFVIGYLEKAVGNNRSVAAVEAALDKVCLLLPAPVQSSCLNFVNNTGPSIAALIAQNETISEICVGLKLCTNGTEIEKPKANPVECAICQFVIGYVDKAIQNNQSQAAVDAALEKVCALLPHSMNATCVGFVEQYAPLILQYIIAHGTPDAVCQALKLCANKTQSFVQPEKSMPTDSPQCTLCQFVIGYLEKAVGNNRSVAAVEAALDKVCLLLPAPVQSSCLNFVNNTGPSIAALIAQNETISEICVGLKLCTNGTEVEKPKANPVECAICQFVIGYVDKAIQNNQSQAAVDAALEKVCALLPHSMNATCVGFVEQYAPLILQYIIAHGTPDAVCQALKLCANKTEEFTQVKSVGGPQCALCKYVIAYVDAVIQTNQSEAAVDAALENVCKILPHSVNSSCIQFVDTFGPKVVEYIAKYGTPDKVCEALGLCKNGSALVAEVESVKPEEKAVGGPVCSLCEFVVGYVLKVVENNKSEAAFEHALEKVCLILPQAKRNECVAFVDKYGTQLIELIEKLGTPKLVCAALGVCTFDAKPAAPVRGTECALCKYVVSYVDAVIQTNQSEAAINAALEKVCKILPHALNSSCVQFVDTFGPELAEYIAKYGTPDKVCNAIGLCKNGSQIAQSNVEISSTKPIGSDSQCTLCKYVVAYIDVLLQSNKTEQEVVLLLDQGCKLLPEKNQEKCLEFVGTYGPVLPELVAELDDPNVVCVLVSMCKPSLNIPSVKFNAHHNFTCTLCEYLVNYLDAIISSNATEVKFEDALEKACKILPTSKTQGECKTFVDLHSIDIIKLLVELGQPEKVCKEIGICEK